MEFSVNLRRSTQFVVQAEASLLNFSMVGLTGPSGAGKSSLLRALAGLESYASVRGQYNGQSLTHCRIGLVFQEPLLLPHQTVAQNLTLAQRYAGDNGMSSSYLSYDSVIANCQCEHLLAHTPAQLSGGEAQRVALARALLNQPQLLLLDEPLGALDLSTRSAILSWLKKVAESGLPMLMVSHDVTDLWLHCQSLMFMNNGSIELHDVPGEVINTMYQRHPSATGQHVAVLAGQPCKETGSAGQLTSFECEGQLLCTRQPLQSPDRATLNVAAHEIVLDRAFTTPLSLDNTFMCEVEGISPVVDHQVNITLKRGKTRLYAMLSQTALARLALTEGDTVRASFPA